MHRKPFQSSLSEGSGTSLSDLVPVPTLYLLALMSLFPVCTMGFAIPKKHGGVWVESQLRADACSTVAVYLCPISWPWEGGLYLYTRNPTVQILKELYSSAPFMIATDRLLPKKSHVSPFSHCTVQNQMPRITTAITRTHRHTHTHSPPILLKAKGLLATGTEELMRTSSCQWQLSPELEDSKVSSVLKDQGGEKRLEEVSRPF